MSNVAISSGRLTSAVFVLRGSASSPLHEYQTLHDGDYGDGAFNVAIQVRRRTLTQAQHEELNYLTTSVARAVKGILHDASDE